MIAGTGAKPRTHSDLGGCGDWGQCVRVALQSGT
jgi:hypothetical protein